MPPKRRRSNDDVEVHTNEQMKTETNKSTDSSMSETSSNEVDSIQQSIKEIKKPKKCYTSTVKKSALDKSDKRPPKKRTKLNAEVKLNTTNNSDRVCVDRDPQYLDKNECSIEKCDICGQLVNSSELKYYQGHPQNAIEENIALTNAELVTSPDGVKMKRPHTNITGFSIFDQRGHLCPLDSTCLAKDIRLYISGYLKPICSDTAEIDEHSIPVKDIGPVLEWFIRGFDHRLKSHFTLSTEFAEYNLQKPSKQYKPIMDILYEKIWICKVVVEFLKEEYYLQPTYEELLEHLRGHSIPELNINMSEELLHKHAHFLCDQMIHLKADDDDDPLIAVPCMRELIKLIGVKFDNSKTRTKIEYKKVNKKSWTKATTTPLVRKSFESIFSNQLDKTNHELVLRRQRCGICEACQRTDCGECNACRAMAKFGGSGRSRKACDRRFCTNMAILPAEESDTGDDADQQISQKKRHAVDNSVPVRSSTRYRKIKWIGEPVQVDARKVYYEKVEIDDSELRNGDFVMVETALSNIPSLVAKIVYMWKEVPHHREGYFHGEVFMRSSDTVLGEVGDPREVFLCDRCCHRAPLSCILRKACVEKKDIPDDWFNLGGKEVEDTSSDDDGKTYFYSKYYKRFIGRFEDLPEDPTCPNELRKHRYCPSCERKTSRDVRCIPRVVGELAETSCVLPPNRAEWSAVKWQGHDYKKGCGVFLKPRTFKFKSNSNVIRAKTKKKPKPAKVDENIYTEYYRKSNKSLRGSNVDTGRPFCVGYIVAVTAIGEGLLIRPQDIYLRVNVMYRPENTKNKHPQREDLNVVYWSDEVRDIPFSAVTGPCHLIYVRNVPGQDSLHEWLDRDPNRFYFSRAYNSTTGRVVDVPSRATAVGKIDHEASSQGADTEVYPLRALDVFAGCGGLSEGLRRAGVARPRWAVENEPAAAHAYSVNNENCSVFTDDCNAILRDVMDGETHRGELRLPRRGEVELICGGPPCQGFSGMNRFNSRDYSNFKNSLIASLLSYCDYYRPQYFILENVRNFVAYKRGMVLKLTMRALLDMGYQCTFGVLQAGHYGVPQTRRRLIVLAAAPGRVLPLYPEPSHVFSRRACFLPVMVDGKRFTTNVRWERSAPRRTCTVRDAMSDLPEISDGATRTEIDYGSLPESHFQRAARGADPAKLRDHICKKMAPLVQARISRIPTAPGSDWRDLPNIAVELADSTKCKVLQYRHDDKRNGRSRAGALRGVCACASGMPCSPQDKQENTLIPWCLPHTANRHNHWAGLYGRLSWEGYFSTTVTDPEPLGKQGRVLHPSQPRVVSVRECARSQGFPDHYVFAGSPQDKHRQVGNAVPPPLGAALGREIKKAMIAKDMLS